MDSPIVAIGMNWMDYPQSSIHAPLWVIEICGGLFVACGVWLMVHGANGLRRWWNMANGKQQLPESPWLWVYPWQAQGITDNKFKESLKSIVALAVFWAFLAPFNWIAFVSDSGGIFWQIHTGLFDVMILFGVGSYLLKREGGQTRESIVVCYQMYHDTQTIRGEQVNETGELRCAWNLPDDKYLTSTPSERPAKFWKLEVQGTRSGMDYHSRFLLPVHAGTP